MGSTRRRFVGLNSDPLRRLPPSQVQAPPPVSQFVKVVLDSTMETKMLKIPPRFAKSGPKLSDIVTLETPAGLKREIGLKRVGDEVWFQDGWSEFAEHHAISKGHMLLFEFRGNSSFRVLIFDMSATETDYKPDCIRVDESDDEMEEGENGEGEGDGFLASQGTKEPENEIIDVSDVSVESDVKPAMTSNPGSSASKRKKNVSLIDDTKVKVIDLDELLDTKIDRDENLWMPVTRPSKKLVEGRNRYSQSDKPISRNERGQSTKLLDDDADLMDIEVLEEDEIVYKQGVPELSYREKKHAYQKTW